MIDYDVIAAVIIGLLGIIFAIWFTGESEKYSERQKFDKHIQECMEVLNGPRENIRE